MEPLDPRRSHLTRAWAWVDGGRRRVLSIGHELRVRIPYGQHPIARHCRGARGYARALNKPHATSRGPAETGRGLLFFWCPTEFGGGLSATKERATWNRPITSLERRHRALRHGIGRELRATFALAAPFAAANLAQMAMGVTNTVMVGRLGAIPLAAAGLGGMFYFTLGIVIQGVLFAVAPLAAHARGAGDRLAAGRIAGAGLVLAILLSLPFVAALTGLHHLLEVVGYDAGLAAEIDHYLRALAWGGPAFLGFAVLRSVLAAFSHARSLMVVLLIGVAINALLSWSMIFGHLGMPALGVVGSGYASAVNQWLMLGGLALCIHWSADFADLHLLRDAVAVSWTEMASILRLGLPIGAIRGIEAGVFTATGILMGLLGAAALGAHQLVINCASISFMVPLGLSQAATVRVAYQVGAGRPFAARQAGFVALALGIGFMAAAALLMLMIPRSIIAVYVDTADPANRELV